MKLSSVREKKFTDAYNSYSDALFRFCFFRIFDRERAKELMQEAFTRSWDYVRRGNDIKNIRAFLYKTARHLIIDEARKKSNAYKEDIDTCEERLAVPAKQELDIDIGLAYYALKKLDEPCREAVTLRFVEGFSPKEIAAMVGESENVVSVRIHRGILKLRALLLHNDP